MWSLKEATDLYLLSKKGRDTNQVSTFSFVILKYNLINQFEENTYTHMFTDIPSALIYTCINTTTRLLFFFSFFLINTRLLF